MCAIEVFKILAQAGIPAGVANLVTALNPAPVGETFVTNPLVRKITFTGSTAVGKILAHDIGVLSAATAFGKTVAASAVIAERGVNTLVLVHRRQLMDQWRTRLSEFLGIPATSAGRKRKKSDEEGGESKSQREIGQLGGGVSQRTGLLTWLLCRVFTGRELFQTLSPNMDK